MVNADAESAEEQLEFLNGVKVAGAIDLPWDFLPGRYEKPKHEEKTVYGFFSKVPSIKAKANHRDRVRTLQRTQITNDTESDIMSSNSTPRAQKLDPRHCLRHKAANNAQNHSRPRKRPSLPQHLESKGLGHSEEQADVDVDGAVGPHRNSLGATLIHEPANRTSEQPVRRQPSPSSRRPTVRRQKYRTLLCEIKSKALTATARSILQTRSGQQFQNEKLPTIDLSPTNRPKMKAVLPSGSQSARGCLERTQLESSFSPAVARDKLRSRRMTLSVTETGQLNYTMVSRPSARLSLPRIEQPREIVARVEPADLRYDKGFKHTGTSNIWIQHVAHPNMWSTEYSANTNASVL